MSSLSVSVAVSALLCFGRGITLEERHASVLEQDDVLVRGRGQRQSLAFLRKLDQMPPNEQETIRNLNKIIEFARQIKSELGGDVVIRNASSRPSASGQMAGIMTPRLSSEFQTASDVGAVSVVRNSSHRQHVALAHAMSNSSERGFEDEWNFHDVLENLAKLLQRASASAQASKDSVGALDAVGRNSTTEAANKAESKEGVEHVFGPTTNKSTQVPGDGTKLRRSSFLAASGSVE
eukprot:TRINITY_DN46263_c0_g1_i1.p1 TRINITY_DN46263_c0_g1~~TRINITY_DN46263_c0_g1_i1.p1  ORF type:complete len:236 (-),score=45.88 TRINITY_DN46263_c0_g1_i1:265-972(-)